MPFIQINCLHSTAEGKWDFQFDEDTNPGFILLQISVPKHLSSALIDVDVHPTYVTIVIKAKILRLVLPEEVKAHESTAQRSTASGKLLISMPKCLVKLGPGSYIHTVNISKPLIKACNSIQNIKARKTTLGTDMIAESLHAKGMVIDMTVHSSRRISHCQDVSNLPRESLLEEEVPPPALY